MQAFKSQQTEFIVQSACTVTLYVAAKYFREIWHNWVMENTIKREVSFGMIVGHTVAKILAVFNRNK